MSECKHSHSEHTQSHSTRTGEGSECHGAARPGDGGKDHGDPQGRVTARACPTPRQEQHPKLSPYRCHNYLMQVHKFLEQNNFGFLILIYVDLRIFLVKRVQRLPPIQWREAMGALKQ